ncbi:Oidioi.mRNA.OKI2018_I69.PAR.g10839.t1.cds [Oikopleura dioica]|uniref:Oidioi.mRNA.OKI2018_I69.PAR.g10839.t1.cds n=1 Tax=Oikopleura dioica TaxID=34765 RepID=A0ABN7RWX3_OIKDI|nr:Oidioi.mRNA.OKI2018_I69.PAR.g10839.t1.cds [Oikopleura dioica]
MVELKLKCVTCSASFSSDEIYSAHREGHKKAEEWLRVNLPKSKSTKRKPSPVKTVIEEPPPMSMIPLESQAQVLRRAAKPAISRRSAPIMPSQSWRKSELMTIFSSLELPVPLAQSSGIH